MAGFEERMAVLGPHLFEGLSLARAAQDAGAPVRTAGRWLAAYCAEGSAGLLRSTRSAAAGRPKTTLAREFGISRETVYQYLRANA